MSRQDELRMYLRKTAAGAFRLETEDGGLVVETGSYLELRQQLDFALRVQGIPAGRVKILIGAPPPRPLIRRAYSAAPAEAAHPP